MSLTLKAIRNMSEAEIETAYQDIDMYENRHEYRLLAARREELFQVRITKLARFTALVDLFYKDVENSTYGIRYGSEDDHIEMCLLGERYGWDIPSEAK